LGVLSSTQIISTSPQDMFTTTRLDSSWSYDDQPRRLNYRVGDIITGGLSWTRPTRLGGLQIQRNFGLRPDLVTMPLPELSGSAAVPSTVDVYIDNARRLSREVPAGPFTLTNLPVSTGNGTARLVVRDALGRETVSETPFHASSELLAAGLWDLSLDAGLARQFYGIESNDYDGSPMVSGMVRYGFNDWLTIESHAEGGNDLLNGGIGSVFGVGSYGIASLAGAASMHDSDSGYQASRRRFGVCSSMLARKEPSGRSTTSPLLVPPPRRPSTAYPGSVLAHR
jgi:outer membrane usher protein